MAIASIRLMAFTGRKFYLAFLVFSYQNFLLAWKWEMHVDLIRMRRVRALMTKRRPFAAQLPIRK